MVRVVILVGLLSIIGMTFPGVALAQGVESEEFLGEVGPYEIRVSAVLSNLSIGQVLFYVTILEAATGLPVPDARVVLRSFHDEDGAQGWANALNTPDTPDLYEARMILRSSGTWRVSVDVDSPLGQEIVPVVSLDVPSPRRYSDGTLVFAGVFLVLVLGVGYVWWSARRANRQRSAS